MKKLSIIFTVVAFTFALGADLMAQESPMMRNRELMNFTKQAVRSELWVNGVNGQVKLTNNTNKFFEIKKPLPRLSDELQLSLENLKI